MKINLRLLGSALSSASAPSVLRALRLPSLSSVHTIYHPPTLTPVTVEAGRRIIRSRFMLLRAVANMLELRASSNTTLLSLNGEMANNGHENGENSEPIYDVNGSMDLEVEAAMMDEVVEQHKHWNVENMPGLVFHGGANAVSLNSDEFKITGHVSSSFEPNFFFSYDKSAYSNIDGLNSVDAAGRTCNSSMMRFREGSGPAHIPLIDQQGRTAMAVTVVCLDWKKFGKEWSAKPSAERVAMVGFQIGLGNPNPSGQAAQGMAVFAIDTQDLQKRMVASDGQQVNLAFPTVEEIRNTGLWAPAPSQSVDSVLARSLISYAPGLINMVEAYLQAFDVPVRNTLLALRGATEGKKSKVTVTWYTNADGDMEPGYWSGPHSLADALTDERVAEIADKTRDGKVFVGGITREPMTIEELGDDAGDLIPFGVNGHANGTATHKGEGNRDPSSIDHAGSHDPNRPGSGGIHPMVPSHPEHGTGEPSHSESGLIDSSHPDGRHPNPGHTDPIHVDPIGAHGSPHRATLRG